MSLSHRTSIAGAKSRALPAIFSAGLLCGVLDLTAAFLNWGLKGVRPARLLQGITAGALGVKSFDGGMKTAALGGAIHFLIAFTAAAVFYAASRKLGFMVRRPVLAGVLYAFAVYLFMYWVVMPLSRYPYVHNLPASFVAILTHIACVGLPISLVIHRFST